MSNSILAKSKLQKHGNINKKIKAADIDLEGVSIEDLVLKKDNFDEFINLKNLLDNLSSCQLSDAYNGVYRQSGVISAIKSINNNKVYGRIFTAETNSNDWGTSAIAISCADEGDILFIKSSDEKDAIWGELASTDAKSHGIAGVVVYGSVRDLDAMLYSDFPIFACNNVPNAGKPLGLGKINQEVVIDNVTISPGDFLFGDENGVVIIPSSLFCDVIKEALSIKLNESNIISMFKTGESLQSILSLDTPTSFK